MSNGQSEEINLTKTYIAGGVIVNNTFVKLDANGEVLTCGAGEQAKGVAMESAVEDAGVSVALMNAGNIVQVRSGAAVTQGAQVSSNAAGKVIDSLTTNLEMGQADEGSGALDEFAIIHLTQGRVTV